MIKSYKKFQFPAKTVETYEQYIKRTGNNKPRSLWESQNNPSKGKNDVGVFLNRELIQKAKEASNRVVEGSRQDKINKGLIDAKTGMATGKINPDDTFEQIAETALTGGTSLLGKAVVKKLAQKGVQKITNLAKNVVKPVVTVTKKKLNQFGKEVKEAALELKNNLTKSSAQKELNAGTEAYRKQINSPEFERRALAVGYINEDIAKMRKRTNAITPQLTKDQDILQGNMGVHYPLLGDTPIENKEIYSAIPNLNKTTDKIVKAETNVFLDPSMPDIKNTGIHELDHNRTQSNNLIYPKQEKLLLDGFSENGNTDLDNIRDNYKKLHSDKPLYEFNEILDKDKNYRNAEYLLKPTEISARMQEIRHQINPKDPYKLLTEQDIDNNFNNFSQDKKDLLSYLKDKKKFVSAMNKLPAVALPAVGINSYLNKSSSPEQQNQIYKKGNKLKFLMKFQKGSKIELSSIKQMTKDNLNKLLSNSNLLPSHKVRIKQLLEESGNPEIELNKNNTRAFYTPIEHKITVNPNSYQDLISEIPHALQKVSKTTHIGNELNREPQTSHTKEIIDNYHNANQNSADWIMDNIPELTKYFTGIQNTNDFSFLPKQILYDKIGNNLRYKIPGTVEHEAHSIIEPDLIDYVGKVVKKPKELLLKKPLKYSKGGKNTSDIKEMISGITTILNKVKNKSNRKEISDYVLKDLKKDKINIDKQKFLKNIKLLNK
jgi:hypothetical protein